MKLFAQAALLEDGWARNVAIDIGDDGVIAYVARPTIFEQRGLREQLHRRQRTRKQARRRNLVMPNR